jgi:hypothetical protein
MQHPLKIARLKKPRLARMPSFNDFSRAFKIDPGMADIAIFT